MRAPVVLVNARKDLKGLHLSCTLASGFEVLGVFDQAYLNCQCGASVNEGGVHGSLVQKPTRSSLITAP
jgi:hypothetical protein